MLAPEQLLHLLGSRGHGDARVVRRGVRAARMHLPVTENGSFRDPSDQLVTPIAGRQVQFGLRRAPGHAKAAFHVRRWIRERSRRAVATPDWACLADRLPGGTNLDQQIETARTAG